MGAKYFLAIKNDQGSCSCEAKDFPNDILESGNVIVSFGKNYIEFFNFSQVNNNDNNNEFNNNNNITNRLEKIYEIPYNNNNNTDNNINNDNNINDDNPNQILCIELYKDFIICGHKSGLLTTWKPCNNVYLQKQGEVKVGDSAINKITTITYANQDYLFLCCSDKTIKLFSITKGTVENISQQFEDEVMDIKKVTNLENQELVIISLKNGMIKVLKSNLNPLFDMNSRFGVKNTRYVLALKNPQPSDEKGDFILVTEGNRIDVFEWIKAGSLKLPHQNRPFNQNQMGFNPHNNPQFGYGPHPGFRFHPHGGK